MKHTMKTEHIQAKEFLVIKGYGKLYDPDVIPAPDPDGSTWDIIRQRLNDGSVEHLKKAAGSETVYMLFCNTCVRNDEEKCYVCGYDIACENLNNKEAMGEFEIVRLTSCEYAVFDCVFDSEAAIPDAHEKPDDLFWKVWLKENPYVCAIDDPANCKGNGFAAIELYSPFEPDANKFIARMWYPIIRQYAI